MEGAWRKIILFEGQNTMLANFSSYWSYLSVTHIRFCGIGKANTTICLKKSLCFCLNFATKMPNSWWKLAFLSGAMLWNTCAYHTQKNHGGTKNELHMWSREEASCRRHRLSTLAQRNRKKTETQRRCAAYYTCLTSDLQKKGDCWVKVCNTKH